MGEWTIVIHGTGGHHNPDYANDADRMFQRFVDALNYAGHRVESATFTYGGRHHALMPEPLSSGVAEQVPTTPSR